MSAKTYRKSKTNKFDIYQIITDRVIELVENNPGSWMKPWSSGPNLLPQNYASKTPYRGTNLFLTSMLSCIYGQPYFMTYNQVKEKNGQVKKGEKGFPVVYWNWKIHEYKDADGETQIERQGFCQYYTVFNVTQCDGLDLKIEKPETQIDFNPIGACEDLINGYKSAPKLVHEQQRAFYRPSQDLINIPEKNTFKSNEEYYSTLFHEMGHSTGHESRLNREGITNNHFFGDQWYSKEELIAEPKLLMQAAQSAQKAVDLIANYNHKNEEA